jgi:hypothetical protein
MHSVEVLKVRLQLANAAITASEASISAGLVKTARTMFQQEGIRAFYSGFMPAIIRGLFYGGVRLGMIIENEDKITIEKHIRYISGAYGPIKNLLREFINDDKRTSVTFVRDVTAGCLSGSIAAIVSNPIDLCKTKLQTKSSPYRSSLHVIRDVVKHHGVQGLWVGTTPAAIRTGKQ